MLARAQTTQRGRDDRAFADEQRAQSAERGGMVLPRAHEVAHLIRIPEAARITGLPASLLRKSFMCEQKRPRNVPPPPPHKRIGRAVYIVAGELPKWIEGLGNPFAVNGPESRKRRGRPTVAERIMNREGGVR
jgi:hypothetical protein